MSVQAISWAFEQSIDDMGCKFVLIAIANETWRDGVTYTGQRGLAGLCSCSERTVREHMATLERGGLIARARRFRKNGSRTSDWIVLGPAGRDRAPMKAPDPNERGPAVLALLEPTDHRQISPQAESATGRSRPSPPADLAGPPVPSEEPSEEMPPQPPASGGRRKRDHERFEKECARYGAAHFADLGELAGQAVSQAVRYGARTAAEVRAAIDRGWRRRAA